MLDHLNAGLGDTINVIFGLLLLVFLGQGAMPETLTGKGTQTQTEADMRGFTSLFDDLHMRTPLYRHWHTCSSVGC